MPPRIEAPAVAKKKLPPKEPPFDTKPMDARFKGEQDAIDPTTGAVREMPVRYLSESERSKFELKVGSDGKLYTADGKLYDSDAAADRGSGRAIFVMSKDGRIYVMQPGQKGRFNHSSFLAGEGVAAAGEITVQNGVVTYLSDRSGHYMPETEHTLQLVYRLQGRGADVTKMKVKAWNLPEMSAADFVEKAPSKLPDAQG